MNVREFITGIVVGLEEGGPGSGHWGHRGIPGQRGGSLPGQFSVKGDLTGLVMEYLERIPTDPAKTAKAEAEIAALQKMAKEPWIDKQTSRAIREAIARYRYEQAITNKQIEVTPRGIPSTALRPLQEGKLANSDADPDVAEGHQALLDSDFAKYPDDYDGRAMLKDDICERLAARSGLPYEEVNARIKEWAVTSNDTSVESLIMQEAARREFGSSLSPWQKNQWKESGAGGMVSADEMRMHRRFLRAMYDETQERLRSLGVPADGFVTLYRGVRIPGEWYRDDVAAYEGNAIESWSTSIQVAVSFAGNQQVLDAAIPANRIISTATTGFGCLVENEVVVLGGLGPLEVIMR